MVEKMYEDLKTNLFENGVDAIEDFLGYEIDPNEDKDVIENRLNSKIAEMSEIEAQNYYNKYYEAEPELE